MVLRDERYRIEPQSFKFNTFSIGRLSAVLQNFLSFKRLGLLHKVSFCVPKC